MSLVSCLLTTTEEPDDFMIINYRTLRIHGTAQTSLRLRLFRDYVALESDETFQVQLSNISVLPSGENVFFVHLLNVIIKDQDGTQKKLHGDCLNTTGPFYLYHGSLRDQSIRQ